MKKSVILILSLFCMSCIKEQVPVPVTNLLLGNWQSNELSIIIRNTDGIPEPYSVLKVQDSLHVKLMPAIDEHFKIIKVDNKQMVLSKNDNNIVFERMTSDWGK